MPVFLTKPKNSPPRIEAKANPITTEIVDLEQPVTLSDLDALRIAHLSSETSIEARRRLNDLLQENPAVCQEIGSISDRIEEWLLARIDGQSPALRESIRIEVTNLRSGEGYAYSTIGEQVLINQMVWGLLETCFAQIQLQKVNTAHLKQYRHWSQQVAIAMKMSRDATVSLKKLRAEIRKERYWVKESERLG